VTRHGAIEDQALDWLIRRDEPDWSDAEQVALDTWLDESVAHKAAYWRVEHGWHQAERIRSLGPHREPVPISFLASRRWWSPAMAATLLACLAVGAATFGPNLFGWRDEVQLAHYDTPVGGRRLVPLADGSRVELNTRTMLRAAIGNSRREIWLDAGEAYFEVAHRSGRPFIVHIDDRTVTVLGTKFSIRRDNDRVTVSVVQGRVRLDENRAGQARAAIISAGDTAIARGSSTLIAPKSVDRIESALAWRDGMLGFDQTRLSDVAAEFNRYNRTQLIVTGADVAKIPIGGTFEASNIDAFARLLHDAYGLDVEKIGDSIRISR
jgi:transmembrane sensor